MKIYLGNGIYIRWDGVHYILTIENGEEISHVIRLDSVVMDKLIKYVKREIPLDDI